LSNDEPETLTAIVKDMANALNETFKKEEGILVTNGWKLDIAAMQRYVTYVVGKTLSSFCQLTYQPAGKQRTTFCALPTCQLFQQHIILVADTENSTQQDIPGMGCIELTSLSFTALSLTYSWELLET
jgi:hypothetical protein